MDRHVTELLRRFPELETAAVDIQRAYAFLESCYEGGGKVLLCGNGGSAADCEHWAGELVKGFKLKRPLDQCWQEKLPAELHGKLQGGLPAIPLASLTSLSTAICNDIGGDYIFAQMVWGLGRSGDVLVGLSTSGNSGNVCLAVEAARARGLSTIGLTGRAGGRLADLCHVCIKVPAEETYKVQEYHLPVYHCLCLMLEEHFFGR